ncbi:BPSL0761 family protein [Halopseudomonas nanhaiensis]|uniref:BPSL0761 family protein n=1 Tax=Halopseudomonas nanhaiensis TaxID=2830842 RepID=UPI00311AA76C
MTMPDERTKAVLETREFLLSLKQNLAVPDDVRRTAQALLRHYPEQRHLASVAAVYEKLSSAVLDDQGLALLLMSPVFDYPGDGDTPIPKRIRPETP